MTAPSRQGVEHAKRDLLAGLNVRTSALATLADTLDSDFSVDDGGYVQFGGITDVIDRAIASDQVMRSAHGVIDTLLEARLHLESLEETCTGGLTLPRADDPAGAARRSARIDMDITGFGRALGSALDCLTAVAIGVLRLPLSLQRASISDVEKIPNLVAKNSGTPRQRSAWNEFHGVLETHRSRLPDRWYQWLLGIRNLNIHRARHVRTMLQRTIEPGDPQLAVVTNTPADVLALYRFDLHLRKRPDLPDMHELIEVERASDLWINEPATDTLHLVLTCANDLLEDAAALLVRHWRQTEKATADFPPPTEKWARDRRLGPTFDGLTPGASPFTPHSTGMAHPQLAKRLELAERLSGRRTRLPN
jgi:hypothetical protein